MQIETLKMFCDLVETKSFSRAARMNNVTRSAVSQALRLLEQRYDTKFVERNRRAFHPTESGRQFYRQSKDILKSFTELESHLLASRMSVMGTVHLVSLYTLGTYLLPRYLRALFQAHPHIGVHVEMVRHARIFDEVAEGGADFALATHPPKRAGLDARVVGHERFVCIASPRHALAAGRRGGVSAAEIRRTPFIAYDRDMPTRRHIDKAFRDLGITLAPVLELDHVETVKAAVEAGVGVALVPETCVPAHASRGRERTLAALPLTDLALEREIALVYRRSTAWTAATRAFLDILVPGDAPAPDETAAEEATPPATPG